MLTEAADVYSFGIVIHECFARHDPTRYPMLFGGLRRRRSTGSSVSDNYAWSHTASNMPRRHSLTITIPDDLDGVIADCLEQTPSQRPDFQQLQSRLSLGHSEGIGAQLVKVHELGQRQGAVLSQVLPSRPSQSCLCLASTCCSSL